MSCNYYINGNCELVHSLCEEDTNAFFVCPFDDHGIDLGDDDI